MHELNFKAFYRRGGVVVDAGDRGLTNWWRHQMSENTRRFNVKGSDNFKRTSVNLPNMQERDIDSLSLFRATHIYNIYMYSDWLFHSQNVC
mgnify:CR=1 FL=1